MNGTAGSRITYFL